MKNIHELVSVDGFYHYRIIDWENPEWVFLLRSSNFQPYVVAHWPEKTGDVLQWGQGHYFDSFDEALDYYVGRSY